jgi:hypothetical protein
MPDEARGKTFAAMRWVSADAANFGISGWDQSFACHCDKLAASSYAVVRAHFAGSGAKKAGEGEICQGYHLRSVCAGEWNDFEGRTGGSYVFG